MKLTTGILAVAMMTGASWAQNPGANNNQGNAAAGTSAQQTPQTKPTPGAPAPAVKPVVIPGAKPVTATKPASSAAAKPVAAPAKAAEKPASVAASIQNNRLERVNVVHNADDIQIEISSREAVTPRASKLSSPARVVVELPSTVMATPQSKIAVGSAGVKGVRIGMDGKKPPTTSVVVDLEQAIGYELTPGPGNKFILTLHTKAVAKNSPAPVPAKTNAPANNVQTAGSKPAVVVPASPKVAIAAVKAAPTAVPAKTSAPAPKAIAGAKPVVGVSASTPKVVVAAVPATTITVAKANPGAKAGASKAATTTVVVAKGGSQPQGSATTKIAAKDNVATAIKKVEPPAAPKPEKKWAMTGKRDPFFSPVVQQTSGSGCSTGKKCLEIGQINVRGVVKAESGFIAVVTNSLNKAYFLHENDPVFNGFVVRITGDSVVFQETMQDKLGKPFTREVVKRITTPAV